MKNISITIILTTILFVNARVDTNVNNSLIYSSSIIGDTLLTSELSINNDTYIFEGIKPVNVTTLHEQYIEKSVNLFCNHYCINSSYIKPAIEKLWFKEAIGEVDK